MTKKKAAVKNSQAPTALVYFITMLVFLLVIGGVAFMGLKHFNIIGNNNNSGADTVTLKAFNLFFARVDGSGVLQDATVIRIAPSSKAIKVIPISAYTMDSDSSQTYKALFKNGGVTKVLAAVKKAYGISIDNYATISSSAFENLADLVGGIAYTPTEELYYLSSESNNDDISIAKGELATLTGHQIRLICQYPVFSGGKQENVNFLGTALSTIINNGFQQATVTSDNLDNIYKILTKNSTTDWSQDDYDTLKGYLKIMLDQNLTPATVLNPTGTWSNNKEFTLSDKFKDSVQTMIKDTTIVSEVSSDDGN